MTIAEHVELLAVPVTEIDHVRGDVDAPVTLVEYGEFECPHCGRAYHSIKELLERLPGRFRFVFRHSPRDDVHPFSERSALAAEAAGAQGRFWEMHDFLFERQHQLEYDDLFRHAEDLGLDVERFGSELSSQAHLPRVRGDLATGSASGVDATPTFFINGVKHTGSYDRDELMTAILAAGEV